MTDIERNIREALDTLKLPEEDFFRCYPETAKAIVEKAKEIFVEGNPSWWWESFRVPAEFVEYPDFDAYKHLNQFIHPEETRCWFVADTEEEVLPVYDARIQCIGSVLDECFGFEYFLISQDYSWLIIENHHNQLCIARSPLGKPTD